MKLNFKKLGEGIPVVILHGLFGSLDNWQTFANQLSENYEVYLVDQRNHGRSPHSDQFGYDAMAEDLKGLFDEHYLRSAYLIGHSMGGKTAMFFAQRYPELLDKLVVLDIGPRYYQPHHQEIIKGLKSIDLNVVNSRTEADKVMANHIPELGVRQFLLKNLYWIEKEKLAWRINLDILADKIEEVGKALYEGEVHISTLFVRGGKSNYVLPQDEELIKRQFPNSRITTIENSGHWVHAEAPKELLEVITVFFNS